MLRSVLRVASRKRGCATAAAEVQRFHPAFVRENTWESWDKSSRQRLEINLSPHVSLQQATMVDSSKYLVRFSDGHEGHFSVPEEAVQVWGRDLKNSPQQLWGSASQSAAAVEEMMGKGGPLRFSFDCLQHMDGQRAWAEAMHQYGAAIVDGMPVQEDAVVDFAKLVVGYVYPTVYGDKFTIKAVSQPNNLAFSSLGLQQHTDLPFYSVPPSIQLFHCIQQAEQGGESLFFDGFDAAYALKAEDPEAFSTLSKVKVRFQDLTAQWHLSSQHPILTLDEDGESLARVCFNERSRDSWRDWTGQEVENQHRFYNALRKYERLVEDRQRYVRVVLQPGEMACTDNWRVMHSRGGFSGARHLEGAYVDWDAVYARWRAGEESSGLALPSFGA